ncbi:MAG: hypothetical protein KCHDKBKB_01770 [Elusimicrobia bacterium]|nr:hypothetical protein [Elusimicrobiota bacterium]
MAEISTAAFPNSYGENQSSITYNLNASFTGLRADVTYYARVKAVNHNEVGTLYLVLGTTVTKSAIAPTGLDYTDATSTTLTAQWNQVTLDDDFYTLQVSSANNFSKTITSSDTLNLNATVGLLSPLQVNTTYYARVRSVINGSTSAWTTEEVSTATLAEVPLTVASTWTAVNFSSLTFAWTNGNNPEFITKYVAEISTEAFPNSYGENQSSITYNLNASFTGLRPAVTYYARVKAVNHNEVSTLYLVLGSTVTKDVGAPSGLVYLAASSTTLTAQWNQATAEDDFYNLQVSSANDFTKTITSSDTMNLSATVGLLSPLQVNTTYYARVRAVVNGSTGSWTTQEVSTATLAEIPQTLASTWTAVNFSSITFSWSRATNPNLITKYVAEISTAAFPNSYGENQSSTTYNLNAGFTGLRPGVTYYAQVKAVNHNEVGTLYLVLGSTKTRTPTNTNVRYWVATSPGNWSNPNNWSLLKGAFVVGADVPSSTHTAVFNGGDGTLNGNCLVDTAVNVASLTISGYTGVINTQSYDVNITSNVTITSGDVILGTSVFSLGGNFLRTGGSLTVNTSTLQFTGGVAQTLTPGGTGFYHLTVTKTAGVAVTWGENIEVQGNFTIASGSVNASASHYRTNVGGDWSNTGVFVARLSTVTLSATIVDGRSSISGSTTFYALRAVTPGATLYFAPGTTSYVVNMVEWRDISVLSSGASGTTWYFSYTGSSQTLAGLQGVRDSNASVNNGKLMVALGGVDLGNNTNWIFSDTGARYWISSVTGNWSDANNWSYVSGGGVAASATVPTSTHTVIFDGANGKNGQANVDVVVNVGTLTVSGYTGTLNTRGYDINISSSLIQTSGTIALTTNTVTVGADLLRSGGTFTVSSSTVSFTGSGSQTLNMNNTNLFNLHVNKSGGVLTLLNHQNIAGSLRVSAGTLNTGANYALIVASHVVLDGGTLELNASSMSVTRNWTKTAGTFSVGTSTVYFIGGNTQNLLPGNAPFHNVVFNSGSSGAKTYAILSTVTVAGKLTIDNSSTGAMTFSTGTIEVQGEIVTPDAINHTGTATLLIDGTGDQLWTSGATTAAGGLPRVQINKALGTLTLSGTIRTSNSWTYTNGTIDAATNNHTIVFAGTGEIVGTHSLNNITFNGTAVNHYVRAGTTVTALGALTLADGTIRFGAIEAQGDVTHDNTFDGGDGTLMITGNANRTIAFTDGGDLPGITLNAANVTINGPVTSTVVVEGRFEFTAGTYVEASGFLDVRGAFVYTGGTFTPNNGTLMLSRAAQHVLPPQVNNLVVRNGLVGYWRFDEGTGDFARDWSGTGNDGDIINTPDWVADPGQVSFTNPYALDFDDALFQYVDIDDSDSLDIQTSNMTMAAWLYVPSLTGWYTKFIAKGINWPEGYAFGIIPDGRLDTRIQGTGVSLGSPSSVPIGQWFHVALTYDKTQGVLFVNGSSVAAINATGNATPNTTHLNIARQAAGNDLFRGSIDDVRIYSRALSVAEVARLAAGEEDLTHTITNDVIINGDLTVEGTVLDISGRNITVGGNIAWNPGVTLVSDASTVTLDGTNQSITGSATYYNLIKQSASTDSLYFALNDTQTVRGSLTLQGASGAVLSLNSTSPGTQWRLDPQGARILSYLDVSYSNNINTNTIVCQDHCTDGSGGNTNTNWLFPGMDSGARYWVSSDAGVWSDPTNWALESGKVPYGGVPLATHTVVFDGVNGANGDADIDVNVAVTSITIAGYTGTLDSQNNAITLSANFHQESGAVLLNNSSLLVGGDMVVHGGNLDAGTSLVSMNSSTRGQRLDVEGRPLFNVVSSNTHSAGLTLVSSFTASQLLINTGNLSSGATVYFAGQSTFTISTFTVTGMTGKYVTLRSTSSDLWYLNNTSSNTVMFVDVSSSDANPGLLIIDFPSGVNSGSNTNWNFDPIPGLASPTYLSVNLSSITAQWGLVTGINQYQLEVSTNSGFLAPVTSSVTTLSQGTTSNLLINTTYFFQVASLKNNAISSYRDLLSTSTLADMPQTLASTWTAVNYSSITFAWSKAGNPDFVTRYTAEISTEAFPNNYAENQSSITYNLNASFMNLRPAVTYYARVKAVNHNEVSTDYLVLGSTVTKDIGFPNGLAYIGSSSTTLTAQWNSVTAEDDFYTLQVSSANDFSKTITSSDTMNLSATVGLLSPLQVNTTYYARVRVVVNGSTGSWTTQEVSTATLAEIPQTLASTWTAVNFSSITFAWSRAANPDLITKYVAEISTAAFPNSYGENQSSTTYNLNAGFTGLRPGVTYYAQVKAVNHNEVGTLYLVLGTTVTKSAIAPTGLDYTDATSTTLTAQWNQVTLDDDFYTLQVSSANDFTKTITSSDTLNLSATVGLLSPLQVNTTYYARVRSVINGSTSAWTTEEVSTATLAEVPLTVASTWTAVNFSSLTFAWTNGNNPEFITKYVAEISTEAFPNSYGENQSSITYNLNASFMNLRPAVTYYARVKAVNHNEVSTDYLVLGSTVTKDVGSPSGLQYLAASSTTLTAQWNPATAEDDFYTLQVSSANDFSKTITSSDTMNLSATVGLLSPLQVNTTYYARVRVVVNGSTGSWTTQEVSTATLAEIPQTLASTWTAVNFSSITFSWSRATNPDLITKYVAEISTAAFPNSYGENQSSITYNLNASFTGLRADVTYYARVKAVNHNEVGTLYLVLGTTVTKSAIAPTGLDYTDATSTTLTAQWNQVTLDDDFYTLQVSSANDFTKTITSSDTMNLSATVGLLSPLQVNTTYYARVRSVINGSTSAWTTEEVSTATLAEVPLTVASTWTAVNFSSLTFAWTNGNNPEFITKYVAEISTAAFPNSYGENQSSTTYNLNAGFTGLRPGVTYYAQVKAVNHNEVGTLYLVLGTTVTKSAIAPTGLDYTDATSTTLTAGWNQVTLEDDFYTLQVSSANDFTKTITSSDTLNLNATVGLLSPLQVNTTYYARVRAVVNGSTSPWTTQEVSTATLAVPPASAASTWTAVNFTSITVQWAEGGNPEWITKYVVELSTAPHPNTYGDNQSSHTYNTNATFEGLTDGVTYYFHVKAVNHNEISTAYTVLGSTRTPVIPGMTRAWVGGTPEWNLSTNWSPAGLPRFNDDVVIGVTANDPVMSGTVTVASISLSAGATLSVRGATFTVTNNVSSNGTLILSSTETLNLPGGVWDVDSGTVSYVGTGSFAGLTAGPTYYNLLINGAAGSWTMNQDILVNNRLHLNAGTLNASDRLLTVTGDLVRLGGSFQAGLSTVTLSGNGTLFGFEASNGFTNLKIGPNAATTLLGSDLDVSGVLEFQDGIVSENARREIRLTSAGENALLIGMTTAMNFSSLTWVTSNTQATLPSYNDYPSLQLRSNVAGQESVFTMAGAVTASSMTIYSVGTATQTTLLMGGYNLNTGWLELGLSTNAGIGMLAVGSGNLYVSSSVLFRHGGSALDLGTSTGTRIDGNFLYGGSTGTFRAGTSTVTFQGTGAQWVELFGGSLATVYTHNTSAGGLTFVSSFTAVNLNATGLSSSATIYFTARTTATVTGVLNLQGSAGQYVVLRSTASGIQSHLIVSTGAFRANYVDVKDNNASGGTQIVAYDSVDSGNNRNWDFAAPAVSTLTLSAGPGARQITIAWPAPADDGASGLSLSGTYYIQYGTGQVAWSTATAQVVLSTNGVNPGVTVSTAVSSLQFGVTYYFRINTVDDVGRWSGYSSTASLKLDDSIAPAAVADLVASSTSVEGEIELTWTAPDGDGGSETGQSVASYDLRYSTRSISDLGGDVNAWWSQAQSTPSIGTPAAPGVGETLLLSMPEYGVTYYFAIQSEDASGNVSAIDTAAAGVATQAKAASFDNRPNAVTNFLGVGGNAQIALVWTPVSHVDFWKYQLYRSSVSPASLSLQAEITTMNQGSYVDLGLGNGVTYYYQMVTVDKGAPDYPGVALTSATAVITAATGNQAPNAPVISSSETISNNTFSIRWVWSGEVPPTVDGFRVMVASVDISGALSSSATSYLQIGLLPNQGVTAQVMAYNSAGGTLSVPFTRYARANPPVNSAVTGVSDFTISLDWSENGNVGTPTYQIEYALNNSFTNSTTVQALISQSTLNNLVPDTLYYIRVRALNGDGVATSYDVTLTTRTEVQRDRLAPAPVGGLWGALTPVSANSAEVTLTWGIPKKNVDGTALTDLAGYIVTTYASMGLPEDPWVGTVITTSTATITVPLNSATYIGVRAVDVTGNQSMTSNILRAPDLQYFSMADDRLSWYEYTSDMASQLRGNYATNEGVNYWVQGFEMVEHYTNGKVVKSVKFRAYRDDTVVSDTDRVFEQAGGLVNIVYEVVNGEVVQGSPSRLSYFTNLFASTDGSLRSSAAQNEEVTDGLRESAVTLSAVTDNIGRAVLPSSNVNKKLALFWNNGAKWIKAGGEVDATNQKVTIRTSRLGTYQLRQAQQTGDTSLVQVYPRIITPNGDGANDVVIFQYGEGPLAGKNPTGEIFDLNSAKVATLKPGPDPETTLMWDGKTDSGEAVGAGIYIYQLSVDGTLVNGSVVVAK